MGQYWRAVVIGSDGEEIVKPEDFYNGCGRKLTEHSWILNVFVGEVCSLIHNNPCRVAWVGDYSKGDLSDLAWPEKDIPKRDKISTFDSKTLIQDDAYLINHTAQEYIKLNEYYEQCYKIKDWVVHPLPILTAVGNGLGGGDYKGMNMDQVGKWAMEELEIVYGDRLLETVNNYENVTEHVIFY